ncbi:MAG TPA: FHA domain-containing protein [Planctomycetota bacterium]|nr:FHA domain-containing protein [Planctomycetota bacterium]
MATLVIVEGAGAGKSVPLQRSIILGREKADVIVADIGASREHCKVFQQDGDWFILDLNSRNGTKVNGEKISRWHLAPGDTITIGKTNLRFDAPELPPREAPKPSPAAARPPAPSMPFAPKSASSAIQAERERLRKETIANRPVAPGSTAKDDGTGIVIRETVLQYGRIEDKGGLLRDDVAQRGGFFKIALVVLLGGFLVGVVWGAMKLVDKEVVETPDDAPAAK